MPEVSSLAPLPRDQNAPNSVSLIGNDIGFDFARRKVENVRSSRWCENESIGEGSCRIRNTRRAREAKRAPERLLRFPRWRNPLAEFPTATRIEQKYVNVLPINPVQPIKDLDLNFSSFGWRRVNKFGS